MTGAVAIIVSVGFRDWPANMTTMILTAASIIVSTVVMLRKYETYRRHKNPDDALMANICMAQIIACLVVLISLWLDSWFGRWVYVWVVTIGLLFVGNMKIFGGGSLMVVLFSSAALYLIPFLVAMS